MLLCCAGIGEPAGREDCILSTLRFVASFKKRGLRVTLIRNGEDVVSDKVDYLIDLLFYFTYTKKIRVLWPFLTINLRIAPEKR